MIGEDSGIFQDERKRKVPSAQNQLNKISIRQFLPRLPLSAGESEAIIVNNQVPQRVSYAQAIIGEKATAGTSAKTSQKSSGSKILVPFQTVTRRRSQSTTTSTEVGLKISPTKVVKSHVEVKKSNPKRGKTTELKFKKPIVSKTVIGKSGKIPQDPDKISEKEKMFESPTNKTDENSLPQDTDKIEVPGDSLSTNSTHKDTNKNKDNQALSPPLNSSINSMEDPKITITSDEIVDINHSVLSQILKSMQYNGRTVLAGDDGDGSANDMKKLMQLLGDEQVQTHSAENERFYREQKLKQIREVNALNAQINESKLESMYRNIDDKQLRDTILSETPLLKPSHCNLTITPDMKILPLIDERKKAIPPATVTGPENGSQNTAIINSQVRAIPARSQSALNDSNIGIQNAPDQEKIIQTFLDGLLTSKNQFLLSPSQQTLPPHVHEHQPSNWSSTDKLETIKRNDDVHGNGREQLNRQESHSLGQKGPHTSKRTMARLKKAENTTRKIQKQYSEMQQTLKSCLSMMPPTPPASPALAVPTAQSQPSSFLPPYQIPPMLPRQPMSNYWQPGQFQYQQYQMPWEQAQVWNPQYPGQNQQLMPPQFASGAPQQPYQYYGQEFQPFYPHSQPSQGQYQAQSIPNQDNRSQMLLNDIYNQLSKSLGKQP